MEDLLGSLFLKTVSQNGAKISPRGVEMPQLNAALMSALEIVEWFVLRIQHEWVFGRSCIARERRNP